MIWKVWGGDRNLHCRSAGKLQTVSVWGNLNHTETDNKMLLWVVFTLFNQKRITSNWQKLKVQRYEPSPVSVRPLWAFWNSVVGDVTAAMATIYFFFFTFSKTWKKSFWELKTMIPIIVFLLKKEFFPNKIKSPAELFPSCCYRWKYRTKVLTRSFFLHNLFFICESSWEKQCFISIFNKWWEFCFTDKRRRRSKLLFPPLNKISLFPSSCFTC